MVPNIEDIGSELHLPSLGKPGLLGEAHVRAIDPRTAADRPRCIAYRTCRNGVIREQTGIEDEPILARIVRLERPCKVGLARRLGVESGIQLLDIRLGGDANREAALESENA